MTQILIRSERPVLRRKPWWLRWTAPGTCITLGAIYVPDAIYDHPEAHRHLLAHEAVHLAEQARMGTWWWVARWLFSRRFRLAAEARGYAVQVQQCPADLPYACRALCSGMYLWAAPSYQAAEAAIREATGGDPQAL